MIICDCVLFFISNLRKRTIDLKLLAVDCLMAMKSCIIKGISSINIIKRFVMQKISFKISPVSSTKILSAAACICLVDWRCLYRGKNCHYPQTLIALKYMAAVMRSAADNQVNSRMDKLYIFLGSHQT